MLSQNWITLTRNTFLEVQGVYKYRLAISRIHFLISRRFFTRQAMQYQNAGEVCNVYKLAWDDELRTTLIIVSSKPTFSVLADNYQAGLLTPKITVILLTRGPPFAQCTKIAWCAKNYIDNYIIFQEHQLNSRRVPVFPGVADTLK